jgi:hypothetical protein
MEYSTDRASQPSQRAFQEYKVAAKVFIATAQPIQQLDRQKLFIQWMQYSLI